MSTKATGDTVTTTGGGDNDIKDNKNDDDDAVVGPPLTKKQKKNDEGDDDDDVVAVDGSSTSYAKIAQQEFSLKVIDDNAKKEPNYNIEDCWKEYFTFRRSLENQKSQYKKVADAEEENDDKTTAEEWDKLNYNIQRDNKYPKEFKNSVYIHINKLIKEDDTIRIIEVETTLFSPEAIPHAVIIKTSFCNRPHLTSFEHTHSISYKLKFFTSVDNFVDFQTLGKFTLEPKIELDDTQFTKSMFNGLIQHLLPNNQKVDNETKLMIGKLLLNASLYHDEKSMELDEDAMKKAGHLKPSDIPYRMGWVEHHLAYATGTEKPYYKFFHIPKLSQQGCGNDNNGEENYEDDQEEGSYISESEKYLQKDG